MELQALRYAAMVAAMSFDEIVSTYEAHLARVNPGGDADARAGVLAWLDAADEAPVISSDVHIILVSADFGNAMRYGE